MLKNVLGAREMQDTDKHKNGIIPKGYFQEAAFSLVVNFQSSSHVSKIQFLEFYIQLY